MLEKIVNCLITLIDRALDLLTVLVLLSVVTLVPVSLVCVIVAFVCGA